MRHPTMPWPLRPISDDPPANDTATLVQAIISFDSRNRGDDFGALAAFADSNTESPWTPAVNLNLGLLYYQTGYFSRAIAAFETAWAKARLGPAVAAEMLANQAVAELAVMHARVGHKASLAALLGEVQTRNFQGNAKVQIDRAAEGLQAMNSKPEVSFRCGPYALGNMAELMGVSVPDAFLLETSSTPEGFSLAELQTMAAEKLGMETRVVKRNAGAPVPVPSVMHFKCFHFGAVVDDNEGNFMVKDPTFGNDTSMSIHAVDDESSGYFLIPDGPLPEGCLEVPAAEAATVYGRGNSGSSDLGATDSCPSCNGMAGYNFHLLRAGLAVTDTPISLPSAYGGALQLTVAYHQREADRPSVQNNTHFGLQWVSNWVAWLDETIITSAPATVKVFKPGGGHETFDTPVNNSYKRSRTSGLRLHRIGSGHYELRGQDGSKYVFSRAVGATARKVFLTQFVDSLGNAANIQYSASFFYRIQTVTSSSGRTLHFHYENAGDPYLVTHVADSNTLAGAYKTASFAYENVTGVHRMTSITDTVSIQSSFTYDVSGFLKTLTTPHGTTTFDSGNPVGSDALPRWVAATDPQGNTEKVEYNVTNSIPKPSVKPSAMSTKTDNDWNNRTTYYWSKVMYKVGKDDLTKAHAYHWVRKDGADFALAVPEWEKPPLQDFIWYNYPGQIPDQPSNAGSSPTPNVVGAMVETADGTLQAALTTSTYHVDSGRLLTLTDPSGLQARLTYGSVTGVDTANPGTDATKIEVFDSAANAWRVLLNVTKYEKHLPVIFTDEQGITHTITLNAKGQPTQKIRSHTVGGVTRTETARFYYTTGPASDVPASWSSTAFGYLRKVEITHPSESGAFVTLAQYTYDTHGRVLGVTDEDGHLSVYAHDALDRVTGITYPDGTVEGFDYHQDGQAVLHPTQITLRDGRVVRRRYNSLGQLASSVDPMQQPVFYEWCLCGDIKKLIDAKGQVTTWRHDIQGRVTAKISHDGATSSYQFYPRSGLLKSITLPKDQNAANPTCAFTYDKGGRLVKRDYSDPATPDITFTSYDFLNRPTAMQDGLGTTTWSYHTLGQAGGGRPNVLNGPLNHDALRHTYTHFGRLQKVENVTEPVGTGSAVRQQETYTYDTLGRVATLASNLSTSLFSYLSEPSHKVAAITHQFGQGGQLSSLLSYYPADNPAHHGRLQSIIHELQIGDALFPSVAEHHYGYDTTGRITSWRWKSGLSFQQPPEVDRRWEVHYDAADQLQNVISYSGESDAMLDQWGYAYDAAGNRSYEEHSGTGLPITTGPANRLQKRGGAGTIPIRGVVDKAATVTVNGQPTSVMSTAGGPPFRFSRDFPVNPGQQTFTITATDGATPPQSSTRSYSIEIPAQSRRYEHDLNGNLSVIREGESTVRRYEWDAANRLVKIVYLDNSSTDFEYDGMDQRRIITEREAGGSVQSVTRLLWKEGRVWQEQDTQGRVTRRYFFNGAQTLTYTGAQTTPASTSSVLTTTDHLGSVREAVTFGDDGVQITGRREYDPYGRLEQSGEVPTRASYTGHWHHERSGLELALYRAYDAELGRWICEDPLGEEGGLNLYGYVGNGPMGAWDPLGLDPFEYFTTLEEARTDALQWAYDNTKKDGVEYGGAIAHTSCGYSYDGTKGNKPKKGDNGSVDPTKGIYGSKGTAIEYFHSHTPAAPNGMFERVGLSLGFGDPENFSGKGHPAIFGGDCGVADSTGIPVSLATPKGVMKIYYPDPKKGGNGEEVNLGNVPNR